MEIRISEEIRDLFPDIRVGFLFGNIANGENHSEVWKLISQRVHEIESTMDAESIRQVEGIRMGKQAYRALGKDPNRYRLSAEALMRRIVKHQELYRINTAVDILNLVSLKTGITIGGFDYQKVKPPVELGIGLTGEEFEAIGRGALNVEDLPVYRDQEGVIGNPTSDCMRTRILTETSQILMLITGFYGINLIEPALTELDKLLSEYCSFHGKKIGII